MITKIKKSLISILVIIVLFAYPFAYYGSQETLTIDVLDKERIGLSSDSYKYLIYSSDEVFENTDTHLFLKYRSSDLQRDLSVGEEYTVTVVGWRVPILSWHRNILKIEN